MNFEDRMHKSTADIMFSFMKNQYEPEYDMWYDHYEEHLKTLYNISRLHIKFNTFCQYIYDGCKKHTFYKTGLRTPVLW
jgi:hypothetical protein